MLLNKNLNKRIKIGLKLKFALVAVLFIFFIVFSFMSFFITTYRQVLEKKLEEKGIALTKTLTGNSQSEYFLWLKNEKKLKGILKGIIKEEFEFECCAKKEKEQDVVYGAFFDNNKKLIAKRSLKGIVFSASEIIPFLRKNQKRCITEVIKKRKEKFLLISMPVLSYSRESDNEDIVFEEITSHTPGEKERIIGYAVIILTYRNIERSLSEIKRYVYMFLGFVAGISLIMVSFLVDLALSPIKRLLIGIKHITNGEYSHRVNVKRNDELGELANAFNYMAAQVEKSNKELENYSKELEEKVRQRKKEIEDMQLQLIQAGKLAAIGELSAGIAHELNNPIGGILGYSQFIVEKLKKNPEEVKNNIQSIEKYLSLIVRESQRCKRIIRNLLRFSRASRIEFEPTDINVVLKESIDIIESQLGLKKNIKFETSFEPDLPLTQGNADQLQQVFTNILINAQKAIGDKPDGRIFVKTSVKKVKRLGNENLERDVIEIVIEDNGCGIPKENLTKIFDPFFTTRKTGEGTGLGLSLSYGIIKDHGGDILVESEVGKGAKFIILIPLIEVE